MDALLKEWQTIYDYVIQFQKENTLIFYVALGLITFLIFRTLFSKKQDKSPYQIGDITLEALQKFNGDQAYPVLTSIKGKVYDLSDAEKLYGPGGPYHVFAGRECSRALAIMSPIPEECNDNLKGIDEKQTQTLNDWIQKFEKKYPVVGKIVPMKQFQVEEITQFDGRTPTTPIYVAIKGTVYDLTYNRSKYGPNGPYNIFAGKECARALAKFSLDGKDFNDDIADLSKTERTQLDEWESDFKVRYNIVGTIKKLNKIDENGTDKIDPTNGTDKVESTTEATTNNIEEQAKV